MLDALKAFIIGIVEGITEWLPISSTGHIILAQTFLPFSDNISGEFTEMFNYVIQLGAILAVIVLFWNKIWPFKLPDAGAKVLSVDTGIFKKKQWILWFKVLVAIIPSLFAFFLDDKIDALMYTESGTPKTAGVIVISIMLVLYGVLFIYIEKRHKGIEPSIKKVSGITYKTAFLIGCFQFLSIVPGTSRSGATIIGALIIGVSRPAAAEFSFFMAIPTMVGVGGLKIIKFILEKGLLSFGEMGILLIGMAASFFVSAICIKKLMSYVKRHDFSFFGYYRIVLGIIVFIVFTFFV